MHPLMIPSPFLKKKKTESYEGEKTHEMLLTTFQALLRLKVKLLKHYPNYATTTHITVSYSVKHTDRKRERETALLAFL